LNGWSCTWHQAPHARHAALLICDWASRDLLPGLEPRCCGLCFQGPCSRSGRRPASCRYDHLDWRLHRHCHAAELLLWHARNSCPATLISRSHRPTDEDVGKACPRQKARVREGGAVMQDFSSAEVEAALAHFRRLRASHPMASTRSTGSQLGQTISDLERQLSQSDAALKSARSTRTSDRAG
jgi:hypothetical protein